LFKQKSLGPSYAPSSLVKASDRKQQCPRSQSVSLGFYVLSVQFRFYEVTKEELDVRWRENEERQSYENRLTSGRQVAVF